jgi:hypothetical protein
MPFFNFVLLLFLLLLLLLFGRYNISTVSVLFLDRSSFVFVYPSLLLHGLV